ncbi:hypothetical protein HNY73_010818 [Argiope bruennichi]|uniref:Uncharacterized protein n=1 Tax=Argiope bruennichi TaxID=94029 RepID=A0A8T0F266_ARGBR|nr:hypothetical protein HNY73_010818 [Argiope bruennichi]
MTQLFVKCLFDGFAYKYGMRKFVTTVRKSPLLIRVDEPGDNAIIVNDWIQHFIEDLQLYRLEVQKSLLPQKRLSTETRQDSKRNSNVGPSTTTISESEAGPISEYDAGPSTISESDVGPSTTPEFYVGPSITPESDVGPSTTPRI